MLAAKTIAKAVALNRCSNCGNGMVRNDNECYCSKCGYMEETIYDGI